MLRSALLFVMAAAIGAAQNPFQWRGTVAYGQTLEIKGINGFVQADLATGNEIQVTANKHGHRNNPDEVRVEVVTHSGGVTICSVYPTPAGESQPNVCQPGDGGHMSTKNNDVAVDYTIHVPASVAFRPRTVNGKIEADGLRGDVDAATVNGNVRLSTTGNAQANTVNGSIRVSMNDTQWTEPRRFHTVNGSIEVDLSAQASTHFSAQTVNGRISNDFPMTVQGTIRPRHLEGVIGSGGRELELQTVNGSITIRRI